MPAYLAAPLLGTAALLVFFVLPVGLLAFLADSRHHVTRAAAALGLTAADLPTLPDLTARLRPARVTPEVAARVATLRPANLA